MKDSGTKGKDQVNKNIAPFPKRNQFRKSAKYSLNGSACNEDFKLGWIHEFNQAIEKDKSKNMMLSERLQL